MTNKRTYIIDDDKLTARLVSILLTTYGFSDDIKLFNNSELAMEDLTKNATEIDTLPDIILLDINMPIMDGWQFLEEYKNLPIKKDISIFIITSSIDPIDLETSKKFPIIRSYIQKPINSEKLKFMTRLIEQQN